MSINSTSVIQAIPRTRRGVELMLLMLAVGVSVAAYVNIGLAVQDRVPASTGYYAAGIAVLALVSHLALRFRAPYADPVVLPCAILLNGLGLAMIHRIDLGLAASARSRGVDPRRRRGAAADHLDGGRRAAVPGRRPGRPGSPAPAGAHLHGRPGRSRAAGPAAGPRPRRGHQRRADLDPAARHVVPARASSRSSAWSSSSPATWW
jgi:hypothetical protein